jgi:hypothetical protein
MEQNKERGNQLEWNQFCRLGEMIGDGLHNETDGKWITKEYNRLAKILIPPVRNPEQNKTKNANIDNQMSALLKEKKCDCGGEIKQKRSGAKVAYCIDCNARYVAKVRK